MLLAGLPGVSLSTRIFGRPPKGKTRGEGEAVGEADAAPSAGVPTTEPGEGERGGISGLIMLVVLGKSALIAAAVSTGSVSIRVAARRQVEASGVQRERSAACAECSVRMRASAQHGERRCTGREGGKSRREGAKSHTHPVPFTPIHPCKNGRRQQSKAVDVEAAN